MCAEIDKGVSIAVHSHYTQVQPITAGPEYVGGACLCEEHGDCCCFLIIIPETTRFPLNSLGPQNGHCVRYYT